MAYSSKFGSAPVAISGLILAILIIGGAFWVKHQPAPTPKVEVTTEESTTENMPQVTIETDLGKIVFELYPARAPKTVENFIKLAKDKFYDATTFHRVVDDFVIQGGDPLSKDPATASQAGTGGPGYTFEDEVNPKSLGLSDDQIKALESEGYKYDDALESLPMTTGVLAMANSGPNTNGSQFFIVTGGEQPHLNGRHTVFGKLLEGLDVAQRITQGTVMRAVTISE